MTNYDVALYGLIAQAVLVAVTILYTLATFYYAVITRKMAKVVGRQLDFQTRPVLHFMRCSIDCEKWARYELRHTVINAGVSFLEILDATFAWWTKDSQKRSFEASASPPLPYCLKPGDCVEFVFELDADALNNHMDKHAVDASHCIAGVITYKIEGILGTQPAVPVQCPVLPARERSAD